MKKFNAPWGKTLIVISLLVTVLMIYISSWSFIAETGTWNQILCFAPLLLLVGAAPFIIRGYDIEGDNLLIQRLFWTDRITLRDLKKINFTPNAMARSLRIGGNGGLYSISGWYWNRANGRYRAYVTDLNRTVVLKLANRTIMVSPDRPGKFVEAVNEAVK